MHLTRYLLTKFKILHIFSATQGQLGHLLQKPVLGVKLPEEVEDPRSVKLVPKVQAFDESDKNDNCL